MLSCHRYRHAALLIWPNALSTNIFPCFCLAMMEAMSSLIITVCRLSTFRHQFH